MRSLYISRVKIKNFRNFKNIDVNLGHKEVIIGENNVGKTNFLRAIQLILDPSLSDEDRMLDESDFNDTIENPMENNEEIQIDIFISNFKENKTILTVLEDATSLSAAVPFGTGNSSGHGYSPGHPENRAAGTDSLWLFLFCVCCGLYRGIPDPGCLCIPAEGFFLAGEISAAQLSVCHAAHICLRRVCTADSGPV